MQRESELRQQAQEAIKGLIVRLSGWSDQSGDLLDIIDVLMQVDKKITTTKNPEALVNRLVNYIRSVAIKGRLHFPDEEEKLMIDLGIIGQNEVNPQTWTTLLSCFLGGQFPVFYRG
ncbi:bacteriocin immunity protein, partial [Lactiplantibacillus plantarum]|uniref:bacteriocin immunity protein n=1 Tax=Lactiplantibacillus plantarum TaxID=1590 RepID=UPI000B12D8BF